MSYASNQGRDAAARPIKLAIGLAATLLVVGAIYLMAVRGPAILLDLAANAGQFFCL